MTIPAGSFNRSEQSNYSLSPMAMGRSIAQHGELFQGQVEDESNRSRRCLVSLPCKALYSEAVFAPNLTGEFSVNPAYKAKVKRAAELTREHFGVPWLGGAINITSTIPEAKGCGSSTADCIAAARAVAEALGRTLAQEELGRLVVKAEIASDNFMFNHAVLFCQREGVVLEDYAQDLPKLEVVGIDTAESAYVDTLEYPPAVYSWRHLQSFRALTSALRRAIRLRDIRLLGRVATASASINELFLPKPRFKELQGIAERVGVLGIAVAHSGTVLSMLLDPDDPQLERKLEQLRERFQALGISNILRFQT